ncbi:hypothetical protein T484DRAFT_1612086, partial [Baffinella frigidus]
LNPKPSTLNPQPSTLNPQPSTLNPQPSTLNPKPSTLNPANMFRFRTGCELGGSIGRRDIPERGLSLRYRYRARTGHNFKNFDLNPEGDGLLK